MMRTSENRIALVAHEDLKESLIAFAKDSMDILSGMDLIATDGTAQRLRHTLGLSVCPYGHGPTGGDVAIAAAVAAREISAVIFLIDPHRTHSHSADIDALIRQCCVHDVPVALNVATARALIMSLRRMTFEVIEPGPISAQGGPAPSGVPMPRVGHARPAY